VLVSAISKIKNNLAMVLRTQIRLLLPIPGKNTVGVEVPNAHCITVTARELFDSDAWVNSKARIPILLGKNIKNETVLIDLEKAPHLLVAGSTGSGKSVCMNLMIQSLLMHFGPDDLKLIMFDPKVLEFQAYSHLPHLIAPIINEPEKMGLVLRWAINEMERRYIQLADAGVRKMSEFNSRPISDVPQYDRNGEVIPNRLPHIVIIINELGDIMQRNAKEVDNALSRLAAKSRAAGIHMIIATQRSDSKIISGTIKVNFPWRIALKVTDGINSRVIFDQTGAESLLGNGDMLFRGSGDVERIQGGWVTNGEIDAVVDYCCAQRGQVFDGGLDLALQAQEPDDIGGSSRSGGASVPSADGAMSGEPAEGGDRISQALEIIRTSKKASISHLQRRLGIGYNKAADLVDELESLGYLGPQPASGPREIYWDNFPVSEFAGFDDDDNVPPFPVSDNAEEELDADREV
jgi:S-DNA-T family DNA segregation ATPase FtsK/SpoIIIE